MLKKILLGITAVLAIILIAAAFQPSEFKVSRSVTINATPVDIFSKVNDFRQWTTWSPWSKIDPNMQVIFEGPETGEGSVYGWKGNGDVGVGRMTITKSQPSDLIIIHMDFLEPMPNTATAEFNFQPVAGGTSVTWSMYGPNNYFGKLIGLIMNMDKMIGGNFEKGLNDLKLLVETEKTPTSN